MDDQPWFLDEPLINQLLQQLLKKYEKAQKRPSVVVNKKNCPQLFDFNGEATEALWRMVDTLSRDYQLLIIKYDKKLKHYDEHYTNARLILNTQKVTLLRKWLNCPAFDPVVCIWQAAVDRRSAAFADAGVVLRDSLLQFSGQSSDALVAAFTDIPHYLNEPLSLRELSARCFWGDSKFLDKKETLLQELFPECIHYLQPRPLLLSVYIPRKLEQWLFVENQDSFLTLASTKPETTAIVYSAGYRGSATRVRERAYVALSYLNTDVDTNVLNELKAAWFERKGALPVFFWGDLDFAGLGILAAMRQSFPAMTAWRPGYGPMLERLEQGWGHEYSQAAKGKQLDPGQTGCAYADMQLLPAIYKYQRFIDQEAILPVCC